MRGTHIKKTSYADRIFLWWGRQKGCASVGYSPVVQCGISAITVGIMSYLLPLKSMHEGHFWTIRFIYGHFLWRELNVSSIKTSCQEAWGPANTARGREGKIKLVWCWVLGTTTAWSLKSRNGKAGSQLVALPAWQSRLGRRHHRTEEVWSLPSANVRRSRQCRTLRD